MKLNRRKFIQALPVVFGGLIAGREIKKWKPARGDARNRHLEYCKGSKLFGTYGICTNPIVNIGDLCGVCKNLGSVKHSRDIENLIMKFQHGSSIHF